MNHWMYKARHVGGSAISWIVVCLPELVIVSLV